jgi:hypothetical protein
MKVNLPEQWRSPKRLPNQVSPRPEWHGQECEVIGYGVVRFPWQTKYQYELLRPEWLC